MEPIKVSVEVKVDFSESAKQFINNLVSAVATASKSTSNNAKPISVPTAAAPAASAFPTAPKASGAVPTATPAPNTATSPESSVTIDEVRQALAAKVNSHREEIKAKLSEFGAPSVTRLDPSRYMDMLIFLNSLA